MPSALFQLSSKKAFFGEIATGSDIVCKGEFTGCKVYCVYSSKYYYFTVNFMEVDESGGLEKLGRLVLRGTDFTWSETTALLSGTRPQ